MMPYKAVVLLFKNRDGKNPDQTIEFAFASAAREYARDQIIAGKARRALVKDADGKVIESFPASA